MSGKMETFRENDTMKQQAETMPEQDAEEKEQRLQKEREDVLANVSGFVVNTIRDKVAWILNFYPETRDSDIALQLQYWENFQSDLFNGSYIEPDNLYKLARLTTLKRIRAKIQNEYRLFQASHEVKKIRKQLSEEEKEKAVEDKPTQHVYTVYMDDSGKTGDYYIVGSIWFLSGPGIFTVMKALRKLRDERNFHSEFHFSKLTTHYLHVYYDALDILVENANALSFKFLSVERAGIGKIRDAFNEMYYHLLLNGVEHEHNTRRAPLPRKLQVWIDQEDSEMDKLLLASLDDKLKQAATSRFDRQLTVDKLHVVDSDQNPLLQLSDLFTGCVNRVLNKPSSDRNYKDELAEHFLKRVNVDLDSLQSSSIGDLVARVAL